MKQGDIVLMPFPFTDLSDFKVRPALIISNGSFNIKKNVIVVAISTQKGIEDFSFELSQEDLLSGELQKKSYIRFQNIFTVEKRLLIKKVAELQSDKFGTVVNQVKSYL